MSSTACPQKTPGIGTGITVAAAVTDTTIMVIVMAGVITTTIPPIVITPVGTSTTITTHPSTMAITTVITMMTSGVTITAVTMGGILATIIGDRRSTDLMNSLERAMLSPENFLEYME